ncbi:MAG: hypothetical protein ABIQ47_03600 [Tepidiformaceae bacterium]
MAASPAALILGTGVVGRATAVALAREGFSVSGYDPDASAVKDFPGEVISDDAAPRDWAVIAICVPTPTVDGAMSADALVDALNLAKRCLDPAAAFTVIAIRSTIVPGTMESVVLPPVRELVASSRVGICHWPSFARERVALEDEAHPRAIVFGTDGGARVHEIMRRCVASARCGVSFVSFPEAELIKQGAKLFNALKISYFNAIGDWATERSGNGQTVADVISIVAEGCWNPAYGTAVGPPFGGACLPKDLDAFAQRLVTDGSPHRELLQAIQEINEAHGRQGSAFE